MYSLSELSNDRVLEVLRHSFRLLCYVFVLLAEARSVC